MAIVTQDYYNNTYLGEPVAEADFPRYEARAEQLVANVTRNQYAAVLAYYNEKGYTTAAGNLTTAYSNAICAQIEYYSANGVLSTTTGQSGGSFTVGKVSVSSGGDFSTRGAAMLSPAAQMYLEQTGLMGRAVHVPVQPFAPFPLEVW